MLDKQLLAEDTNKVFDWLNGEFARIHNGRPNPKMIEDLMVDVPEYGQKVPLNTLTSIEVVDGKFRLDPWDKKISKFIEETITSADLGLNPSVNGNQIYISVPALTQETRAKRIKSVEKLAEDARIRIRHVRHEHLELIDLIEGVSEDLIKTEKKALQDAIDAANDQVGKILSEKRKELEKF